MHIQEDARQKASDVSEGASRGVDQGTGNSIPEKAETYSLESGLRGGKYRTKNYRGPMIAVSVFGSNHLHGDLKASFGDSSDAMLALALGQIHGAHYVYGNRADVRIVVHTRIRSSVIIRRVAKFQIFGFEATPPEYIRGIIMEKYILPLYSIGEHLAKCSAIHTF